MKKLIATLICVLIYTNINAITVLVPKSPPTIPVIKAMQDSADMDIEYYTSVNTQIIPKIIKNEDYLYLIPTNLAAKLSLKVNDIRLLSVLSTGLLSVVGIEEMGKISGLEGKKLYIGAQGSSPDVITRYILSRHKTQPNIIYRSSEEIFKLAVSKKLEFAVLPEPLATMALLKNSSLKRLFVLKEEWRKINGVDSIPQVGLFASQSFIEKEKPQIEKLLRSLERAVAWTNENPYNAAKIGIEKMNLNFEPDALSISIPYMNLVYIDSKNSKEDLIKYFEALIEMEENVLNELPREEFYESKIN